MMNYEYKRKKRIIEESCKYMKIDFLRSEIIDDIYYKCIIDDNKKSYLKIFDFKWDEDFFNFNELINNKNPFATGNITTSLVRDIMHNRNFSYDNALGIINRMTDNKLSIVDKKISLFQKIKNYIKKRKQCLKVVLVNRNINMDCKEMQSIKDSNIFINEELENIAIMIYEYKNKFKTVYKISLTNNQGYKTNVYSNSEFFLDDNLFRESFIAYVKENLTIDDQVDSDSIMNNASEYINLIKLTNY